MAAKHGRRRLLLEVVCAVSLIAAIESGCSTTGGCSCSCSSKSSVQERAATDVQMLGEGSDPRVTLRVARWTGLRYRSHLVTTGSLGLEGAPLLVGPTTTMVVDSEVLRGSADPIIASQHGGVARLIEERAMLRGISISQQGVAQPILDFWNQALLPLRGTTYLQNVAESAEVVQLSSELLGGIQPPEEVTRAVDQVLEQQRHFPFRLPPSPVGVGAKWRFQEALVVNGAHVTQAVEMTLKAVDANQANIGIVLKQDAPRQAIQNPLAPGSKAVLESYHNDGGGDVVVDRLTAIVLSGNIVLMARSTLSTETAGAKNVATLVGATSIQMTATVLSEEDSGAAR